MATSHSAQTRAAVLAALLVGQSVAYVAAEFQVSRYTVMRWRDAAGLADGTVLQHEKKGRIVELVIGYLREILLTLTAQQQHFRDPTWLARQSAADLAVLHGVSADKAFRLLGALEFDQPGTDTQTDSAPDSTDSVDA
ncbi:MAG: helix-turn-helix domain-containing protein [Chloroflexota bacterium]